jgi:hypothetical protein
MSQGDVDIRVLLGDEQPVPATDRWWPWVVSAGVVVLIGVLSATSGARVPFLWFIDFGIHEFGHLLTGRAPWRITAFAGSFAQVAFPLGLAAYFGLHRGEMWAAAPLLAWAGASLRNVSVYIADAPYQQLELWGGEGALHDWAQLLQGKPLMHADAVAWFANTAGWMAIVTAFALAMAPLLAQYRTARTRAAAHEREATLPVREPRGPIG